MLRKPSVLFVLIYSISLILSGCSDATEIDDAVYAIAIGIDKGVNNKIILTVQYPLYAEKSGGDQGGGGQEKQGKGQGGQSNQVGGSNVHSIEAATILEGVNLLNMAISRQISLKHAKWFVISEEYAREGIENYVAPVARFRETRRTMQVIITRGKALDFIKENKSNIGTSITKATELMTYQANNTGYFPFVYFNEFYRSILSTYGEAYAVYAGVNEFDKLDFESDEVESPLVTEKGVLPGGLPRSGVAKREFVGTAVFAGAKMVGSLDPYETRYFLILNGKFKKGILSFEDKNVPGTSVPLDIRLGRKPKIKGQFENGIPVINIELNIEADIGAIQSRIDYEDFDKIGNLENQIKNYMLEGINKTIAKTQKELKADIFEFGAYVAGYFQTIQEWETYDWISHYPEARINVDLDVNIRRTGLMIHSAKIKGKSENKGFHGEE